MAETRDFIMARLAAARVQCVSAADAIDACIDAFVDPGEDKDGAARKEFLEIASDMSGEVSRSIELAQVGLDDLKGDELTEEEPELAD